MSQPTPLQAATRQVGPPNGPSGLTRFKAAAFGLAARTIYNPAWGLSAVRALLSVSNAYPRPLMRLLNPGLAHEVVEGAVHGEWFALPDHRPGCTMLYLHGGGYIMGAPDQWRAMALTMARASRCRVFLPRYRLAPEHPHPAAVEDGVAAFRWLLDQGERVVLAGDSAGGALALQVLFAARDQGLPAPAGVVAHSPFADKTLGADSIHRNAATDRVLWPAYIRWVRDTCVCGQDPTDPGISPLFQDYTASPPLLITVGSHECLQDDGAAVAERALAAGVDVQLLVGHGAQHVFPILLPGSGAAVEALAAVGAFCDRVCAETTPPE
ncbi:MAG: alpha/beta hydrolase [Alphaproteobacteria bacterium]|nr:alpha/beta hydrolase [Alphaproteobacteria bacterium]